MISQYLNLKLRIINRILFLFIVLIITQSTIAQLMTQQKYYTHADSIRGTYGKSRSWWDVLHYNIEANFNIAEKSITGCCTIQYKPIATGNLMQIDLQEPMKIDSIKEEIGQVSSPVLFTKDGNAYFVSIKNSTLQKISTLKVYYHGKPREAIRPPWDGGVIWKKDSQDNPWVSIACQGLGASVWYPCKDHQADEPDSASMQITIPDTLVCVGNGRLRNVRNNQNHTATYTWAVTAPINNYTIIPYIGKYVHFKETYNGMSGALDMDYWVLKQHLAEAKKQFTDAPRMMKAFEYWFGPYPFYKDGYKLVEAPHLGMEHQSATAYGNYFLNGYLGRDLSGTGWGLKWDYIIIHESGHEWFANNVSTKDIADMWVHEGFTCYSESLFTEYYYGKKAGSEYVIGLRENISNDVPVIGHYDVNEEGSGDMYYKGANMIHMIRQLIDDDSLFRKILIGLNREFGRKTTTTKEVEAYINKEAGQSFNYIFDQYLRTTNIPTLEYKIKNDKLMVRYTNCINNFTMPIKISLNKNNSIEMWIKPSTQWSSPDIKTNKQIKEIFVNNNFYIFTKKSA